MANPTVKATIPQAASLLAALWVSDQIDQAGPVKGAWDAKNNVYWPGWTPASLTAVACGTSGRNGLASAAVNCGIALASADDHTGTPYDLAGPALTILALVRPVNASGSGSVLQNASAWSAARDGYGLRQLAAFGAFEIQLDTAGTTYEGPITASGAIVTGQMMTLGVTRSAAGAQQMYKNGATSGALVTQAGTVVYGAAGNNRRAALFNDAQSKGTTANPNEIYAVLIWGVALTQAEVQSFGTTEAALLAGSFYTAGFDFGTSDLSGTLTLDDFILGGSMATAAASSLSGTLALDDFALGGSLGMQPGSFSTPPMRNNTGTLLASVGGIVVSVYDLATGALVVRKTGLTSSAGGIVTVTDAALVPGVTYAYEPDLSATAMGRRLPLGLAA